MQGVEQDLQREAEALFQLTAAINEAEGLEAIFEEALEAITRLLRVDRASILLYDDAGVMRFRAWRGLSEPYRRAVDGHSPWKREDTDARPILVGDVREDASLREYLAVFTAEGIRSLGFVPLRHRSRLLGKFMLYSDHVRVFGEREVRLAETVAGQIAQAVARAQLLADERAARAAAQKSAEHTQRLQAVTVRLSRALLPEEVAEIVIDEGTAAVQAWSGAIWVLAEDGRLHLVRSRGYADEVVERHRVLELLPGSPMGDAVLRGEPVWLPSRADYAARYPEFEAETRPDSPRAELAIACLPLRLGGRVTGGLAFAFDHRRALEADDRRLLAAVAESCAQGLERARLYAEERRARAQLARRARQQEALADLGRRALASADLGGLLEEVTRVAADVLGADFAAVLERDGEVLRLRTGIGFTAPVLRDHVIADDPRLVGGFALRSDEVVITDDLRVEQRFAGSPILLDEGAVSALVTAIPTGGDAFGVLGVFARHVEAFSTDDAQFVRGLANVLGAALDRAAADRAVAEASRRKDEFLALLGHELRNPLSPILTALHLMRLKGETTTERERQVIERQVVHLNRLVDDLLDVSRITRGMLRLETSPQALRGIVLRAIEMASPLLEERAHELTTELPAELWVQADSERLAQVIANLLTNAAKYTPPGGRVEVRAGRVGGDVTVTVKDNGRGIPGDALPHLFDPFFQVERTLERGHGGLGLGLALVRSLVELHGGSVDARSAGPGRGSEFTVRIPAAPADLQAVVDETGVLLVQRRAVDPARVRRVLVVDDIRDVADGLADVLREEGHEVVVCLDGAQALVVAERFDFDVGLLDIGLPVMDGFELAQRLRAAGKRGALIAVTGYGQDLDRARTHAAGFAEHLTKPVTAARLLAAVDAQPRLLPPASA